MEVSTEDKEETKLVEESPSRKFSPEAAFSCLGHGKELVRNLLFRRAILSLSTARELYAQYFDEFSLECGEVHFLLGKALFCLSQIQNGFSYGVPYHASGDHEYEDEPWTFDTEGNLDYSCLHIPEETSNEENSNDEQQETEKVYLRLACESLETAKSIYLRQGRDDVEAQLKVAEILQLLAEISMESYDYIAAIRDLKECLEIRKRYLSPDDRRLGEVYYHLCLVQILENAYVVPLENVTTAVRIFETFAIPGNFYNDDMEMDEFSLFFTDEQKLYNALIFIDSIAEALEETMNINYEPNMVWDFLAKQTIVNSIQAFLRECEFSE